MLNPLATGAASITLAVAGTVAASLGGVAALRGAAGLAGALALAGAFAGALADLAADAVADLVVAAEDLEREAACLGFMTESSNDARWERRNCTGAPFNYLAASQTDRVAETTRQIAQSDRNTIITRRSPCFSGHVVVSKNTAVSRLF
ncbi:hypothetical protein [Xanthomonas sp. LMG 8992]|uniref:hypothetical protein n=1 Tax=Xanthomonas sp. LMG 8992 TaxID=1591157 RepID=UPI001F23313D|nr:hypothetical protein [Xanthomonas sp. LMG 8992]